MFARGLWVLGLLGLASVASAMELRETGKPQIPIQIPSENPFIGHLPQGVPWMFPYETDPFSPYYSHSPPNPIYTKYPKPPKHSPYPLPKPKPPKHHYPKPKPPHDQDDDDDDDDEEEEYARRPPWHTPDGCPPKHSNPPAHSPEPGTFTTFGLGLGWLTWMRRGRQ